MDRSTSISSFLSHYENTIDIISLESKYNIQTEKETLLEQNLLWRRRQSLYKNFNSPTSSLESLSYSSISVSSIIIENKYKYQFECSNAIALIPYNKKEKSPGVSILNKKLLQLRKQFQ